VICQPHAEIVETESSVVIGIYLIVSDSGSKLSLLLHTLGGILGRSASILWILARSAARSAAGAIGSDPRKIAGGPATADTLGCKQQPLIGVRYR